MTRADTAVSYTYDADGMRTGKTVTHTHSYTGEVTEPTCTEQGCTTYTCSCGDSYVGVTIAALRHDFGPNGREIYCLRCGADRFEIVVPPITPIIPPIGEIAEPQGGISLSPYSTEVSAYSYVYNGGQLTQMTVATETTTGSTTTTESHVLTFTYDATGNPQTVDYDGTLYYYTVNLQGDVVAIVDSTGTAVVSYTYDAWGNILDTTGTLATTLGKYNPLRYRGYVYDQETKLYYLQSRYYNPNTGRFMNADALVSTGQGLLGNNMFAYCLNNPVNYADPTGCFGLSILIPVIFGVVTLLSGCLQQESGLRGELVAAVSLLGKSAAELSALDRESYNCYGNAIGKQVYADPTGYIKGMTAAETFDLVQKELGGAAYVRLLDTIDDPIADDEYRVMLVCGPEDYHFIRQLDDGTWYNKSGNGTDLVVSRDYVMYGVNRKGYWKSLAVEKNIEIQYYYDSPIYFAIKKGWDNQ